MFPKPNERFVLVVLARHIRTLLQELVKLIFHLLNRCFDVRLDPAEILLSVHLRARISYNVAIFGEELVSMLFCLSTNCPGGRFGRKRKLGGLLTRPKRAGNCARGQLSCGLCKRRGTSTHSLLLRQITRSTKNNNGCVLLELHGAAIVYQYLITKKKKTTPPPQEPGSFQPSSRKPISYSVGWKTKFIQTKRRRKRRNDSRNTHPALAATSGWIMVSVIFLERLKLQKRVSFSDGNYGL